MLSGKPKVLITDGEGPIVFKDLGRDISARRHPLGVFLFDALSLYNACIAETRGPNQSGETLALLVPHLLTHQVTDNHLSEEARITTFAKGVEEYLRKIKENGWQVRIISTAYFHLWQETGPKLGIPQHHIASTELSLADLEGPWNANSDLTKAVLEVESFIGYHQNQIRRAIQSFRDGASLVDIFCEIDVMRKLGARLDTLYYRTLPSEGYNPLRAVEVVSGERKVQRAIGFMQELGAESSNVVYIGDSITDDQVLKFIKESGGLAIAENGDIFAIRNASIAIASEDLSHKVDLLEAWVSHGWEGVKRFTTEGSFYLKERAIPIEGKSFSVFPVDPESDHANISRQLYESRLRLQGADLPPI